MITPINVESLLISLDKMRSVYDYYNDKSFITMERTPLCNKEDILVLETVDLKTGVAITMKMKIG